MTAFTTDIAEKYIHTHINNMAKYGKKAQNAVAKAMHKYKRGQLKSGKSGIKVKSKKQAVAIGLSEAREKGVKVPRAP